MITIESKRPHFETSDSEPEIIYENTPTHMVIQSTEDIPIIKIFSFKIEQILSKQIKPTTIKKKLTNGTILIEVKKHKKFWNGKLSTTLKLKLTSTNL